MDRKAFGKRINTSRKEQGLTSEKLSELCNINATYLRQIESGLKVPSLPVFITLCQQLNVTPSYLLIDSVQVKGGGDIDRLLELLQTAKPNQIKLIAAMLESALSAMTNQ